jgi:dipeptidyl aminopeptidase/acylaminoacyl peptidase
MGESGEWEKLSPFNDIEKITTPTLWIGGAVDWNVPIMNSEQMYLGMKTLGKETQLPKGPLRTFPCVVR